MSLLSLQVRLTLCRCDTLCQGDLQGKDHPMLLVLSTDCIRAAWCGQQWKGCVEWLRVTCSRWPEAWKLCCQGMFWKQEKGSQSSSRLPLV